MNQTEKDVIYLAACAVNERVPDKGRVEGMNLTAVFELARSHMISSVVSFALESAGVEEKCISKSIATAMRRTVIFQNAQSSVQKSLEDAGVWYMPLKGAVLKGLYPKYGMREFSDYDILFDASRAEDVKGIMESFGFTTEHFAINNHDCYYKEPCLNFEMHRSLFGTAHDKKLNIYYQHVEERLLGDGYEKHFCPEDFYLYLLAHEYTHYTNGGTGLRSLLDTYVFLKAETLDMDYVVTEAEKLGIKGFEEKNRSLSLHLFGAGKLTDIDKRMLDYILSSGVYGIITRSISHKLHKNNWTKLHYMLDRFFVPVSRKNKAYAYYAYRYPFFYKHKILLPLLPFYRTFRAIKEGRFYGEVKAIREAKDEASPE